MKYIELRPLATDPQLVEGYDGFKKSADYYLHRVDLTQDKDELFRRLSQDCRAAAN